MKKQLIAIALVLLSAPVLAAGNADAGKGLYALCAGCHGQNAEGNQELNAPALAKQGALYLERQIANYKTGVRGSDPKDTFGAQMRPMALTLGTDQAVADVVAFIKTLPGVQTAKTLTGDAANGKTLYDATCASCHGQNAEGNQELNGPALAGINDWYLERQFLAFKNGLRGSAEKDTLGKQMSAIVAVLPDEKAIKDVMTYIRTLEK